MRAPGAQTSRGPIRTDAAAAVARELLRAAQMHLPVRGVRGHCPLAGKQAPA